MSWLTLIAIPLLGQAAVVDTSRVVVACSGDDVEATGRLQRQLETTVATADVSIVGAEELVELWGLAAREDSRAVLDAARQTLREASAAYYEDLLSEAAQKLREVERLYQTGPVPAEAYRELLLWKLTVTLAMGDEEEAELAARQVIMSAGLQWRLEEEDFRPSVVEFVERVREGAREWPRLRVMGTPTGASLRVDSVPVSTSFLVPPGAHELHAAAAGFRPLTTNLELTQSRAVDLGMALELPEEQLAQLRTVGERSNRLREMADVVVIGSVHADVIEIVVATPARVRSRRFTGEETALALQWAAQTVRRAIVPGTSRTSDIRVEVGPQTEAWRHGVSGQNDVGYILDFVGWGPVIDVDVRVRQLQVRTTISYTAYSLGVPIVDDPRNEVVHRLEGGSAAHARVAADYDLRPCAHCAWSLAAGLELQGETQTIPDIEDPVFGGVTGLGGLQQRVDLGPVARAGFDVRFVAASVVARVGIPLSVREAPELTFNVSPRASWGLEAHVAVAPWNPRLALGVSYFVRRRSLVGTDIAFVETDPYIAQPVVSDLRHGLRVQLSWSL